MHMRAILNTIVYARDVTCYMCEVQGQHTL